jgi:hypothetical protein
MSFLILPPKYRRDKKKEHGMHYELSTVLEDDYETETLEIRLPELLAHATEIRLARKKFDESLLANTQ